MSQDKISFSCPTCGVRLRVPASLAGVKGPCPACDSIIEAPDSPNSSPPSPEQPPLEGASAPACASSPAPTEENTTGAIAQKSVASAPASAGSNHPSSPSFPDSLSSVPFAELPVPFPDHHGAPSSTPTSTLTTGSRALSDLSAPSAPTTPTGPLPDPNDDPPVSAIPQATPTPAGFPRNTPLSDPFVLPPSGSPASGNSTAISSQDPPPEQGNPQSALPGAAPAGGHSFPQTSSPAGNGRELLPGDPPSDPIEFPETGASPESSPGNALPSADPLSPGPDCPDSLAQPGDPLDDPLPSLDTLSAGNPDEPSIAGNPGGHSYQLRHESILHSPPSHEPLPVPGNLEANSNGEQLDSAQAPAQATGFTASPDPSERTLPLQNEDSSSTQEEDQQSPAAPSQASHRRLRWPRFVFPLLFLILAAIIVFLVLDLSELLPHSKRYQNLPELPRDQPEPANAKSERDEDPISPVGHQSSPTSGRLANAAGQEINSTPSPPSPDSKNPLIEEVDRSVTGEVALPPLIDLNPSRNALPEQSDSPAKPGEALSLFLEAKTLAERKPYMTKSLRSEAELVRSPLAGKLAPTVRQRLLPYIKDSSDEYTAHFFEVSFDRESAKRVPVLVQVSEGEDGRMLVHTDAFLDLYNDELAKFGAVPVKGDRTFHAIADAYKRCFEEKIPDSASKSFIKLRQHEQITPRLLAYFEQSSEVSRQISQSDGLLWGRSGICTITVRWNIDHPGQPYVELVGIDSFSWTPQAAGH